MRWHETYIKSGTRRQRTYFTIIPQCVGREWRWLERVTVEEEAWRDKGRDRLYWFRTKFVDPPGPGVNPLDQRCPWKPAENPPPW